MTSQIADKLMDAKLDLFIIEHLSVKLMLEIDEAKKDAVLKLFIKFVNLKMLH